MVPPAPHLKHPTCGNPLQPWINWLALEPEYREHALMHPVEVLSFHETLQSLHAQRKLTQCQGPLSAIVDLGYGCPRTIRRGGSRQWPMWCCQPSTACCPAIGSWAWTCRQAASMPPSSPRTGSGCWAHDAVQALFDEVCGRPMRRGCCRLKHFKMDGTLIKAAAGLKSFRPKDRNDPCHFDHAS